jgi:hypothetical protein
VSRWAFSGHHFEQISPVRALVGARMMRHHAVMDYEYAPLRLPPNVDRMTAAVQLAIAAEYDGWELARVRLFADGTRQVLLRRRRSAAYLPALSY